MILIVLGLTGACWLTIFLFLKGLWILGALLLALLIGLVGAAVADSRPDEADAERSGTFAGGKPADERIWRP